MLELGDTSDDKIDSATATCKTYINCQLLSICSSSTEKCFQVDIE